MANRPRDRQKNVTGQGKSINRRGSGLGTGKVGGQGRTPAPQGSSGTSSRSGGTTRSGGGLSKLIILLLVVLLGGGGSLGTLLGGGAGDYPQNNGGYQQQTQQSQTVSTNSAYGSFGGGSISTGWDRHQQRKT